MAIQFKLDVLPNLYWFKSQTIQLCIDFISNVVRGSHRSRVRQLQSRLKDIEVDLYDLFCRWNFISLVNGSFDHDTFLPTGDFVIMNDLEYYLQRFGIQMRDSFVEFPIQEFHHILQQAITHTLPPPRPIRLSDTQRQRLHSIYTGLDVDADAQRLIARYQYLGGLNNSLSVPPRILKQFTSHELFGTPLNTHTSFCSPFADERVFGSSGSFFSFDAFEEDTVYFANPPFDDAFCSLVATRLLEQLSIRPFHLIVIIPVWDSDQQKKHGLKDFGLPFDCYNRLVQSEYFIEDIFLPKDEYPFFNYFSQRDVYISNVHLINLGKKVDTQKIRQAWVEK
jgi:hypothetical protein